VGVFLAITPVTLRNWTVGKDFVPVTAHSGITFYAGNNPLSDGSFKLPRSIGTSVVDSKKNAEIIAERISGRELKPSEVSSFWFNQAFMFMKKEPYKYAKLIFTKSLLFWNVHEIPDILPLTFFARYSPLLKLPLFNYMIICPLGLFGMLLCIRYRRADILLLYLFVLSIFLSTTIYFVNSRYRLIASPCFAIFSAAAVYWIYVKTMGRKFKTLVFSLAAILALFAFTQMRILEFNLAQAHNSLAIILKRKGLYKEAVGEYKEAIELSPGYDSPHFNLGLLYLERGKYKNAIDSFNSALEINPDLIKAHNFIGDAYMKIGEKKKALYHWKRSLELDPNQPEIKSLISK
jgi:tetratricopeptide (TPR) repeat protein